MQEFFANITRKPAKPLSPREALEWIEMLERLDCAIVDPPLIKRSVEISERFKISYWDGAILAAAEELGAPIVYSEDLSHGQHYGAVQVINPFLDLP